ncbi:Glutathione S-transferase 1 [Diplonema papillatum]|nr:Glutathione S-transferase 1 [Diplonema papillatum]
MQQLKVTYFAFPGRAEPIRLALGVGGIDFEDCVLGPEAWEEMKPKVSPLQLPLLNVDGKTVSQSIAINRYVCKLAKVDGNPLYPQDPFEALLVDELVDKVSDGLDPLVPTWDIEDAKEREAKRAELMVKGGPIEKWAAHIDGELAKSTSGFALLDQLTMADLYIFTYVCFFRSGKLDGIPQDSFDHLSHLCLHREKIADIPQVKVYYNDKTFPAYACFKSSQASLH